MMKIFGTFLFALLALASIPLIADSSTEARVSENKVSENIVSKDVAFWELIKVSSSESELASARVHTRLECSWVCEDGSTGTCYPPDLETCIQEADHACGDN